MKKIFNKEIKEKDTFNRIGYRYDKVYADDEKHIYVFKMTNIDPNRVITTPKYELVVGKKRKNPDGAIVYVYPSDEDFGKYGWFITGKEEYCQRVIKTKIQ